MRKRGQIRRLARWRDFIVSLVDGNERLVCKIFTVSTYVRCAVVMLFHALVLRWSGAFIIRSISGPPVFIKRHTSSAAKIRKTILSHVV